ncbi:MAG: hypothetical protein ACM3MG_06705 [Bacillota bacterium]
METLDKKQVALKQLVDELIKDQPSRQLVKQLTTELGMEYSLDPMTQMNTVLQSMNSVYLRTNRRTDLES